MSSSVRVPNSVLRTERPPNLRPVHLDDYFQIASLASKFDLQTGSYPAWTHLWNNNPAYSSIRATFPIGWALECDGSICGYLGNIPLHYELEGKTLLAATTRSWVVDTAYRTYSTMLLATYFQQRNVDLFMNTSINAQAAPAYDVFQGVRVPVGYWDRTRFWITNPRGFAESVLRKRRSAMPRALSYPLSAALVLRGLARWRSRKKADSLKLRSCAAFDDRFDAFWRELRAKKHNVLLAVRSREALDWHFRFALLQNAAWIYIIENNRGMTGYAIFLRQDSPSVGLSRIRLVDFQSLDQENSPALLTAVVREAVDRCRQERIHMLELIGLPAPLEKALETLSPRHRPLQNWMYCYKAKNAVLAEKLKNPAVWDPWLFDGDSSL